VPRLQVRGAGSVESWLVLEKGAAPFRPHVLSADDPLSGVPQPLHPLQPSQQGPGTSDQGSGKKVFRLTPDPWPLTPTGRQTILLIRKDALGDGPPVRVLLREQVSAAPDGRRWLHETTWWLYHPAPTELVFTLPEGGKILGATLDGREQPFQEGDRRTGAGGGGAVFASARLLISLSGEGARRLSLRWQHQEGREELSRLSSRPLGPGPRLRGEENCPSAWTLHVPLGLHAGPGAF